MNVTSTQTCPDFKPIDHNVAIDTDSDSSSTSEVINSSDASEPATTTDSASVCPDTKKKKVYITVPRRFVNKKRQEVEYYRKKFNKLAKLYVEYAKETDKTRNHVLLVQSEIQRLKVVKRQLCTRLAAHSDNYMDQNLEIPDSNHFDTDVRQLIDDVVTNAEQSSPPAKKKKTEKKAHTNPRPREFNLEEEPEAYEAIKNILNEATTVIQQQQQEQEEMIRRREADQHRKVEIARRTKLQQPSSITSVTVPLPTTPSSILIKESVSAKPIESIPFTTVSSTSVTKTTLTSTTSQSSAYLQPCSSNSLSSTQSTQSFTNSTQTTQNTTVAQPKFIFTSTNPTISAVSTNNVSLSNSIHIDDSHRKKSNQEHYVPPRIPLQKNVYIETFPTTNAHLPQQEHHSHAIVQRLRVSESDRLTKQHHVVAQQNQVSQIVSSVQQTFSASQLPTKTQPLSRNPSLPSSQGNDTNSVLPHHRSATVQQGSIQGQEPAKVYCNAVRADPYSQRNGTNAQPYQFQHQLTNQPQRSDARMHSEQRSYVNSTASASADGQRQVIQVMQPGPVPHCASPVRQPRLREALQNAGARQLQQQQQLQQQGIPLSIQPLSSIHRVPIAKSLKDSIRPPSVSQAHQQQVVQLSQINQMASNNNVIYIDQPRYIRLASSNGSINQYVIPADSVPYTINTQGEYTPQNVRFIIPHSQHVSQQTAIIAQNPASAAPNVPRIRKDSSRSNQHVNDDNIDWSVYNEPIVKRFSTKKKENPRKRTTAIKLDSNSDAMARISPILAKFQEEMAQSTLAQEQQHLLTGTARNASKDVIPARARKRPTKAEKEAAQKTKSTLPQSKTSDDEVPSINVTTSTASTVSIAQDSECSTNCKTP